MEKPFFTVVTITYNSSQWVREAIESVLVSTFYEFEYLISDDCSTDDTWEIIQKYNDPRIRAWRNESNIGEYPNRNKVLNEAKGKYIFYLDGDDILYKDTLKNIHRYVTYFPDAGVVWGIPIREIDFAVLPYEFTPEQVIQLIYLTRLPFFSVIGFAETFFKTDLLKTVGFTKKYLVGDTYIKRKLALTSTTLMIPEGFSYWRQSENQASQKINENYRSFIDMHFINDEILNDADLPLTKELKEVALENTKISEVKLLIKNTLLSGKPKDFFYLYKKLNFSIYDFKYLFKKGRYNYMPVSDISMPLLNEYNLKKSETANDTI